MPYIHWSRNLELDTALNSGTSIVGPAVRSCYKIPFADVLYIGHIGYSRRTAAVICQDRPVHVIMLYRFQPLAETVNNAVA